MVYITPANQPYTRSNQEYEEQQALLEDLRTHPADYLRHNDCLVQAQAYATSNAYRLRAKSDQGLKPRSNAHIYLGRLYRRLREVAAQEPGRADLTPGDEAMPTDHAVDQLIARLEAAGYRFLGRQYGDPATVFTFFAKGDDPAQIVLVHAIYSDSARSGVLKYALYRRVPQGEMPT